MSKTANTFSQDYAQRLKNWADGLAAHGKGKNMIAVNVVDPINHPLTEEVAEWVWQNRRAVWDGQPDMVEQAKQYAEQIRELAQQIESQLPVAASADSRPLIVKMAQRLKDNPDYLASKIEKITEGMWGGVVILFGEYSGHKLTTQQIAEIALCRVPANDADVEEIVAVVGKDNPAAHDAIRSVVRRLMTV